MPEGCISGTIRGWSYGYNLPLTRTHNPEPKSFLLAAIGATSIVLDMDAAVPEWLLVSDLEELNYNHNVFNKPWLTHPPIQNACNGFDMLLPWQVLQQQWCDQLRGKLQKRLWRESPRWLVLFHRSQDTCDCTDYTLWFTHGRPQHTDWPSRGAQCLPIMDALIWNQTAFGKAKSLSTPPLCCIIMPRHSENLTQTAW